MRIMPIDAGTWKTLKLTGTTLSKDMLSPDGLMSEAVRQRGLFHAFVFDNFRRSVLGQVEFVGFVEGKDSAVFRKLAAKVRWG